MAGQQLAQQLGGFRCGFGGHRHAAQAHRGAAIAIANQEAIRPRDLQHLSSRGLSGKGAETGSQGKRPYDQLQTEEQDCQQTSQSERLRGMVGERSAQSLLPQAGQKWWALAVVVPQAPH